MASATPPYPDVSIAPRLIAVTSSLYLVAFPAYGFRMYKRVRPVWNIGLDDVAISIALVRESTAYPILPQPYSSIQLCALISWVTMLVSIRYGAGHHNFYVSADDQAAAARVIFIGEAPWAWAMAMIKISLAFMFLRIKRTKAWRIFLYVMIAIQIGAAVFANCAIVLQCRPTEAIWNQDIPNAKCWSLTTAQNTIYFSAALSISTDLTFSILPITFVRKLDRPLWEKAVLCILMGLGVFATAASIFKTTLVRGYGKTSDSMWDSINLSMWSSIEEQIGIIASCAPCLKPPVERALRRLGVITTVASNGTTETVSEAYYKDEEGHKLGLEHCAGVLNG